MKSSKLAFLSKPLHLPEKFKPILSPKPFKPNKTQYCFVFFSAILLLSCCFDRYLELYSSVNLLFVFLIFSLGLGVFAIQNKSLHYNLFRACICVIVSLVLHSAARYLGTIFLGSIAFSVSQLTIYLLRSAFDVIYTFLLTLFFYFTVRLCITEKPQKLPSNKRFYFCLAIILTFTAIVSFAVQACTSYALAAQVTSPLGGMITNAPKVCIKTHLVNSQVVGSFGTLKGINIIDPLNFILKAAACYTIMVTAMWLDKRCQFDKMHCMPKRVKAKAQNQL